MWEYHNLDEYICKKCEVQIFEEDGYYCCECYQVPMYELAIDAAEIPEFWELDEKSQ